MNVHKAEQINVVAMRVLFRCLLLSLAVCISLSFTHIFRHISSVSLRNYGNVANVIKQKERKKKR